MTYQIVAAHHSDIPFERRSTGEVSCPVSIWTICISEESKCYLPLIKKKNLHDLQKFLQASGFQTHGKKSSVLRVQVSFAACLASVYNEGVEYKALTRPS